MTTSTKEKKPRSIYGLWKFARLYARWLSKAQTQRHVSMGLPPEKASSLAASYAFCLLITLLLCILMPVEFYMGARECAVLLTGMLALCVICCIYISHTNKATAPILLMAVYAFTMCAYLLAAGAVDENTILYYFLVVPVLVACLNTRLGSILSFIYIGMLAILFLPPIHDSLGAKLSGGFRFRFILAITCLYIVSAMAEYYLHIIFSSLTRINRELEQYSLTDSLTGQGNRRNFINQFQRLHALQLRSGEPFTIVMVDLDHFKSINDTHGHIIGDEVLIHVAETLSQTLRQEDSLYRWGGEEFICLLPNTALRQGKVAAERMRKAVVEHNFDNGSINIAITSSFGVYTVNTAQPMHEHLKNSDTLLYQAKAKGRNCVVAADEGSGLVITDV